LNITVIEISANIDRKKRSVALETFKLTRSAKKNPSKFNNTMMEEASTRCG